VTLVPKWDQRFLQLAEFTASWSKDPSTKVGAAIVRPDRTIASVGFNGFPRFVCDDASLYENRDLKYKMVIHAELNAILAAREPLHGCTTYVWPFMPCSNCAGALIQAGVTKVVSVENDNPRWQESFALTRMMLSEASVELVIVPKEQLAIPVVP